MLVTSYLVTAALYYFFVMKGAPIDDLKLALAGQPAKCEIIDLFPEPTVADARKAA